MLLKVIKQVDASVMLINLKDTHLTMAVLIPAVSFFNHIFFPRALSENNVSFELEQPKFDARSLLCEVAMTSSLFLRREND